MNNMLQEKSIIVNKPQRHAGVYAILNILEKKYTLAKPTTFTTAFPNI